MNKSLLALLLLASSLPGLLSAGEFILDRVDVEFDGVGSPRSIRDALRLKPGSTVGDADLEAALARLADNGRYASVSHRLEPGRKGRTVLAVDIVVEPGYRPEPGAAVRIDRIETTGNWKTRDSVILSEFLFAEGDVTELSAIEESVQRVFNRDYFFEADWGLYDEDGLTVMELRLREKWTLFPVIMFTGDDEQTTVMLGAVDTNLGGRGFMLLGNYAGTFYSDPDASSRHNVNALYIHPRLAGSRFSLFAGAGYESRLEYVVDDGMRVDGFSWNSVYLTSRLGYEWRTDWSASLVLKWSQDRFGNDDPATQGYTGYDERIGMPVIGGEIAWDGVDLRDLRRSGGGVSLRAELGVPTGGGPSVYPRITAVGEYHRVFAGEWLNLSSRAMTAYSAADFLPYQATMEPFLRGGSGREMFFPLIFGLNGEFGVAPLRENWMFLEILGFADLAWGGNDAGDAAAGVAYYRVGPGMRLSFPPIAQLTLSLDFAWTERGDTEAFFGMVRFF